MDWAGNVQHGYMSYMFFAYNKFPSVHTHVRLSSVCNCYLTDKKNQSNKATMSNIKSFLPIFILIIQVYSCNQPR